MIKYICRAIGGIEEHSGKGMKLSADLYASRSRRAVVGRFALIFILLFMTLCAVAEELPSGGWEIQYLQDVDYNVNVEVGEDVFKKTVYDGNLEVWTNTVLDGSLAEYSATSFYGRTAYLESYLDEKIGTNKLGAANGTTTVFNLVSAYDPVLTSMDAPASMWTQLQDKADEWAEPVGALDIPTINIAKIIEKLVTDGAVEDGDLVEFYRWEFEDEIIDLVYYLGVLMRWFWMMYFFMKMKQVFYRLGGTS